MSLKWLGSGCLQNEPRQGSSFSLLWVLKCLLRPRASQKDFTHMEQQYGFSSVWYLLCRRRLADWENDLVHNEQVYGFSPVREFWDASLIHIIQKMISCTQREFVYGSLDFLPEKMFKCTKNMKRVFLMFAFWDDFQEMLMWTRLILLDSLLQECRLCTFRSPRAKLKIKWRIAVAVSEPSNTSLARNGDSGQRTDWWIGKRTGSLNTRRWKGERTPVVDCDTNIVQIQYKLWYKYSTK